MKPTAIISTDLADLIKNLTDLSGNHANQTCNKHATQELCNKLAADAKQGDLASVTSLIQEYQNNPQKYNSETFDILVVNALWRSCENGHLECAKILQPFSKGKCRYALHAACENADREIVEFLIPFQDWSDSFGRKCALFKAVEGGSLDVVKLILPHVPSKTQRTEALREACKSNNQAIFDLLYPLSNPQSALKYMENRKTVTEEEKQMLKDAITAEQQNKVLSEAVGETGGAKRKMKM
jgi:ankyrin repeat protein